MFMSVARVNQPSEMLVRKDKSLINHIQFICITDFVRMSLKDESKQLQSKFQVIFYATKRVESATPGNLVSKVIPV